MKAENAFAGFIVVLIAIGAVLLMSLAGSLIQGLVFTSMWNWFIAEWFGIKQLQPVVGVGIALAFSVLSIGTSYTDKEAGCGRIATVWMAKQMAVVITGFVGYLVYVLFMPG